MSLIITIQHSFFRTNRLNKLSTDTFVSSGAKSYGWTSCHAYISRICLLLITIVLFSGSVIAEDGYRMWLKYDLITSQTHLSQYQEKLGSIYLPGDSQTTDAIRNELKMAVSGLLGTDYNHTGSEHSASLIISKPINSTLVRSAVSETDLSAIGPEGYIIKSLQNGNKQSLIVTANSDLGLLYGTFALIRKIQTLKNLDNMNYSSAPKVMLRMANHWDNLNRIVERGYAGLSLWDWGTLPNYRNPRYTDYARFSASIGINGVAINNVNANPRILTDQFLEKIAVLADMFRPYGLKVYISVFFNAPVSIGGLDTADPLDPKVIQFWANTTEKIYSYIPDFGGFLVKADSEGQPGPHGYGRDHADGANMLATALKPYGGKVIWRAFVYDPEQEDRFREAYDEFVPLDGKFLDNVVLQVKNGPIDFQPREPYSPLFGALPKTNTALELQVTQEYFGFNLHLAYMGTYFTEVLNTDTFVKGEGTTVGKIVSGDTFNYSITAMAGVINPGTDRNWTGHPFVQSSWYAFGRLAWDYTLTAHEIADEWVRMTFSNDDKVTETMIDIMIASREAGVDYRSPLGLTHLYAQGHHYGPAPWTANLPRADWTAVYYHKASDTGLGFDRTQTGSNALEQYPKEIQDIFGNLERIPDDYLLWFHHVPWDHKMNSGRTLWHELVYRYYRGVKSVEWMQSQWDNLNGKIDPYRFNQVKALLEIQLRDAIRWRDSCVLYFQQFSNMPIPDEYPKPEHDLDHYIKLERIIYVPDPWYN